jgi:hypothetical protein
LEREQMADLVIEHVNGSVDTTAKPIPFLSKGLRAKRLLIGNTHASQILYVSFDKKKNYRQIAASGELLLVAGGDDWILIKKDHPFAYGSGASTTFEIVMLIRQEESSETA